MRLAKQQFSQRLGQLLDRLYGELYDLVPETNEEVCHPADIENVDVEWDTYVFYRICPRIGLLRLATENNAEWPSSESKGDFGNLFIHLVGGDTELVECVKSFRSSKTLFEKDRIRGEFVRNFMDKVVGIVKDVAQPLEDELFSVQ